MLFARRARLSVLAWAVEQRVAARLNLEFGTSFAGSAPDQIDCSVEVDRQRQLSAITCYAPARQAPGRDAQNEAVRPVPRREPDRDCDHPERVALCITARTKFAANDDREKLSGQRRTSLPLFSSP